VNPLVSVICLNYNQARWLEEAVLSVIHQTYPNVQIILADDASTDDSVKAIQQLQRRFERIEVVLNTTNIGNCRAFNKAFAQAHGKYIIDFACDDVMPPDRIEKQVEHFEAQPQSVGVVFTDALYIDETGDALEAFYQGLISKSRIEKVPEGDVFADLVGTYCIAAPTMMIRRDVLEELKGYDENLAYEDFDFWVRSSRRFHYAFLNESLTRIRRHDRSMSKQLYAPGDRQLATTYEVCLKIPSMIQTAPERQAFFKRLRYEMKHCILTDHREEASRFYHLLKSEGGARWIDSALHGVGLLPFRKRKIADWLRRKD